MYLTVLAGGSFTYHPTAEFKKRSKLSPMHDPMPYAISNQIIVTSSSDPKIVGGS